MGFQRLRLTRHLVAQLIGGRVLVDSVMRRFGSGECREQGRALQGRLQSTGCGADEGPGSERWRVETSAKLKWFVWCWTWRESEFHME